jgi:acetate---CoA ligase (ADP-forming)
MIDVSTLDALFRPRSVAVVGASATTTKIGGIPVDYLKRFGFEGRIYPVNPKADEVQGLRCYASLRAIQEPIDLAVFAIPRSSIDAAIDDAIAAGVRAGVMFSAGYAEIGEAGAAAQAALTRKVQDAGLRIIGPNGLGVMNVRSGLYATFSPAPGIGRSRAGHIGLVSQSGAFGAYAYSIARERGIGLSVWASTGNEADVQLADCIAWMARDPDTRVIMIYMEGCRDGDSLREALALAHAARKPVVCVKVGRTALGAQAARSHTAALAGDDAVYDAVFRQYGVYRARDVSEFFNVAQAAVVAGLPRNDSVALFTLSGGVGAFMADEAADVGLDVRELPEPAQRAILDMVPFAAPRNPIDITGQVSNDPTLIDRATRVTLEATEYGSWVGFMAAAGAGEEFWPLLESLVTGLRNDHPEVLLVLCTLLSPARRDWLAERGCLTFAEPSEAVRTVGALARISRMADRPVPPMLAHSAPASVALPEGAMDEPTSLAALAAQGVPVVPARLATSAQQAASFAAELVAQGMRVAVKVVSRQILHKSDVGGVRLGIEDADAAARAFDEVIGNARRAVADADVEGALVAPMIAGGVECILGVRNDPVFGPVVMFGLGGAFVEVLRDVSFRIAPLTRDDALEMVREVRAFPLLDGARGRQRCDLDAIVDALLAVSRFAMATRDTLDSVDVNPFVAFPAGAGPGGVSAVALDAVVIGRRAAP